MKAASSLWFVSPKLPCNEFDHCKAKIVCNTIYQHAAKSFIKQTKKSFNSWEMILCIKWENEESWVTIMITEVYASWKLNKFNDTVRRYIAKYKKKGWCFAY